MNYTFDDFMDIIRELRSEHGCPWDKEQTHESLKPCLLEECYEVYEAIDKKDPDNLCEELGDILLQVALHSVIAKEEQAFGIEDVIDGVATKLIRRHPHVFGDVRLESAEDVLANWDIIKKREKQNLEQKQNCDNCEDTNKELSQLEKVKKDFDRIPKAFPSTIRATKVQKVAKNHGMDFENLTQVIDKVEEELEELKNAIKIGQKEHVDEEFGDLLFTMVNLSRFLHLNAENSLTNATNKFINRFVNVSANAEKSRKNLCDLSAVEQNVLWGRVKSVENKIL